MTIRNALSIDVEDYFQVTGFERDVRREDWDSYPSRVVPSTRRILKILEDRGVKATFLVLGWVADRFPKLVREIDDAGHEIGSHGYWHRLVYELTPDEFRHDLCRSRDLLQDIIGRPVTAYRAPSFSITSRSLWALDILAEEGFQVDLSIFPIHHHRCGIPGAPPHPHVHRTNSGNLWEFPASVAQISGANLPISGGGYFRLFPYWLSGQLLARVNNQFNQPFVFYIHPWELDPEQPRLRVSTRAMRFCHYVNLAKTETKLKHLLGQFSFDRVDRVLDSYSATRQGDRVKTSACEDSPRDGARTKAVSIAAGE